MNLRNYYIILACLTLPVDLYSQSWENCINNYLQFLEQANYDSCQYYLDKAIIEAEIEFGTIDTNYIKTLQYKAVVSTRQQKFSQATNIFQKLVELNKKLYKDENQEIISSLDDLGVSYYNDNKFDSTYYYFKQSLEMRQRVYPAEHLEIAVGLNNIAFINRFCGKYDEAAEYYRQVIALRKNIIQGDDFRIAAPLNSLAIVLSAQGLFDQAEEMYLEAIGIWRRLDNYEDGSLASVLNNLGLLYQNQQRYLDAELALNESFQIKQKYDGLDSLQTSISLNCLASLYADQGRYAEAEKYLKQSLIIRRKIFLDDNIYTASSLNDLAKLFIDQGRYNEAEPLLIEALEIRKRMFRDDHPSIAASLNSLASLYRFQRKFSQAEDMQIEALDMLGRLYKGNQQDIAASLRHKALIYLDQCRIEEAELALRKSLSMQTEISENENYLLAETLFDLAELNKTLDRTDIAENLFVESIRIKKQIFTKQSAFLSESEKNDFWQKMQNSFDIFNAFAIEESKSQVALHTVFDNMLFSKKMLLQSTIKMKNSVLNSGDDDLIADFDRWIFIKQQIASFYAQSVRASQSLTYSIDSLELKANEIEKTLSLHSNEFSIQNDATNHSVSEIINVLQDDEAAIEIVRLRNPENSQTKFGAKYFALIAKGNNSSLILVAINDSKPIIDQSISNYLNNIKSKVYDEVSYSVFWSSIAENLIDIKRVYLAPDGVYHQINISTLLNTNTQKFVFEEIDLHLIGTTKDIEKSKVNADKSIISNGIVELFGNPQYNLNSSELDKINKEYNYPNFTSNRSVNADVLCGIDRSKLQDLKFAKLEIDNIETIIKTNNNNLTIRKHCQTDASEEAIKSIKNPIILHIATHALYIKDDSIESEENISFKMGTNRIKNPLFRSMLFFAGAENTLDESKSELKINNRREDGILTAYEAQDLQLKGNELTVLAACETGLGDINGEGVYGMQRAIEQAGAKTTIISLWTVNDQTSQEFMRIFYSEWFQGKSKRAAFRIAQKEMKDKYEMPYYWGAYLMIGE